MLLMKDIIDDSNELIRTVSKEVELPLSKENHDLLMKMHEFLVASQDEELSEKYDICVPNYTKRTDTLIMNVVKKNTLMQCVYEDSDSVKKGILVDIFPIEYVSDNK